MTFVALGLGVVGRILSPTIVLDLVALWPMLGLVVPAVVLGLRGGRRWALPPLVVLTWLLVGVGLHLGSLTGLPSTAAAVEVDLGDASEGRLVLSAADLAVSIGEGPFTISPRPTGGTGGVPVVERVAGGSAVSLAVSDDVERSVWFRFGSWDVDVPSSISWDMRVTAATVDADLTDLTVSRVELVVDSGVVRLGTTTSSAVVEVDGTMTVVVPSGSPVTVVGEADVPAGWSATDGGAASPADGVGWLIEVVGGSVRISEG